MIKQKDNDIFSIYLIQGIVIIRYPWVPPLQLLIRPFALWWRIGCRWWFIAITWGWRCIGCRWWFIAITRRRSRIVPILWWRRVVWRRIRVAWSSIRPCLWVSLSPGRRPWTRIVSKRRRTPARPFRIPWPHQLNNLQRFYSCQQIQGLSVTKQIKNTTCNTKKKNPKSPFNFTQPKTKTPKSTKI